MSAVAPPRIRPSGRSYGLLTERAFQSFLASEGAATAGYALYGLAVVWLAIATTGRYEVAGAVLGLEFGIYAASFVIGPFVDRAASVRAVAIAGYGAQAACAALLGVAAAVGAASVPVLLGLVAALSVAWDFTWTATNALLPRLVVDGDLFLATGLTGAAGGVTQIVGAAAGAVLLVVSGPAAALLLYAAFNVAALVALLPVPADTRPPAEGTVRASFAAGWRHVFRGPDPALAGLTGFSALQGLVSAAPAILIVVAARSVALDATAAYALLGTALAGGTVAGSLLLGAVNPRRTVGRWLVGTVAIEAVLYTIAPFTSGSLGPSLAVWFALGAGEAVFFSAIIVYLQATTPQALQGRAFTNTYLFRGAARAVGSFGLGLLLASVAFGPLALALAGYLAVVTGASLAAWPALLRTGF